MERIPILGATLHRLDLDRLADEAGPLSPSNARLVVHRLGLARGGTIPAPGAGELLALSLLHEATHLAVLAVAQRQPALAMPKTLDVVRDDLGGRRADRLLTRFATTYPGIGPRPPTRLEDLLLVRLANENPAAAPLHDLIEASTLPPQDLAAAIRAVERHHATEPLGADFPDGLGGRPLIEVLRDPARQAPDSLMGQLRYVRDHWRTLLGDALADLLAELLARLDIAIGILAEEGAWLHRRFGGGPGDGRVDAPSFAGDGDEPEAFSVDSAWMPQLVLIAKSTYVWLDQLSRRYGRDIRTLDAIPDEELDTLARWGVTGLWLIGLWQRSVASERIKRMRGNPDAVASAYSLDDYRIADDLGGETAIANLRERAWSRGIRLASDMVPNHMGIDSRWVIEHPEWFLSLSEPPYPVYSYTGEDLSSDGRVGVVLEDHYWNDSDAAVTFKRFDRATGDERYIYHGNDGTSFPWNDTAQLDFLRPDVREQVIRTIIAVARRFPVIRFDAAMVLAKRHIQRLWWPLPGAGDAIPSRAAHALSQREFDQRMPQEFWREVVDRVAAEAPDTLLLAEAFWMLEGYFVRTLGMHRVYNSAFMHMLRDENGIGYHRLVRETLAFDPEILKRYVNFMSNPDEKTAVEQFGKGDKYFGVATVMATLPGLPMFGHGQVEGFTEKYGMEFRRATLAEWPDGDLVARHEREIFPLLHRRAWFAEVSDFLFYNLVTESGHADEHVYAYSNGAGPTRSLVLYHGRFGSTHGRIRDSVPYARKSAGGAKRMVHRSLAEGLGLPRDDAAFVTFRDARTGLEHLHSALSIWDRGLEIALDAYETHVFWEFRDIVDGSAGQWRRLWERLGGRGVPSLESEMREVQLEPVHAPLRALFWDGHIAAIVATPTGAIDSDVGPSTEPPGEARRPAGQGIDGDLGLPPLSRREAATPARQSIDDDAGLSEVPGGEAASLARQGIDSDAGPGTERKFAATEERLDVLEARLQDFLAAVATATGVSGDPEALADSIRERTAAAFIAHAAGLSPVDRAALLGWLALSPMGALAPGADVAATSAAWFDELRLGPVLAGGWRVANLDEAESWAATDRIRALLRLPLPSSARGRTVAARDRDLLERWLAVDAVRAAMGVNTWEGTEWLSREGLDAIARWAVRLDAIESGKPEDDALVDRLTRAAEAADYRVDRLLVPAPIVATRRVAGRPRRAPHRGPT